jgi:hypothetical protein
MKKTKSDKSPKKNVSKQNDARYISENLNNICNRAKDWYSR